MDCFLFFIFWAFKWLSRTTDAEQKHNNPLKNVFIFYRNGSKIEMVNRLLFVDHFVIKIDSALLVCWAFEIVRPRTAANNKHTTTTKAETN